MQSLDATSISFDHTFKLSKNVGYHKEARWVRQFSSVFIVMNEDGYIIAWAFTRSVSFDEVKPLLCGITDRLSNRGTSLTTAYLDNCCQWRNKLHLLFGPGIDIKLDLFYAMQRITGKVSKRRKHRQTRKCLLNDLSLIFRAKGDPAKGRKDITPSPNEILNNLDDFCDNMPGNYDILTGIQTLVTACTVSEILA